MPRYRMMYHKSTQARFMGHLDTMKNFERAFRRAGLPLAFSQGFNPHPKISFASPLAVGVTGEAEYVDFNLSQPMNPKEIKAILVSRMPPGFEVIEIGKIEDSLPALMSQIAFARYVIEVPLKGKYSQENLEAEIRKLLERVNIEVERETKKGKKIKNIKSGVHSVSGIIKENKIILELLLDSGSNNNIRPEEVLQALEIYTDVPIESSVSLIHRSGVYINKDNKIHSPMADLSGEE